MNVIDSVIAWENAKRNCDPESIRKRAEKKTAELFPPSYIAKVREETIASVNHIFSEMERKVL